MNNRNVVVDIDGVLADFEGRFCETFGYERRELVSLESRYPNKALAISRYIDNLDSYINLDPISLGLEIVEWLNEQQYYVDIVTSRPYILEGVTRKWLKQNKVEFMSLTFDTHKTGSIAIKKPLCAVDDLFSVHKALKLHNIPCIVVAQPWNRYIGENMPRISDLSEFITEFTKISR